MSYWTDLYKARAGNVEFIDGLIAGMTAYAVWKDGRQVLAAGENLVDEIAAMRKELLDPRIQEARGGTDQP